MSVPIRFICISSIQVFREALSPYYRDHLPSTFLEIQSLGITVRSKERLPPDTRFTDKPRASYFVRNASFMSAPVGIASHAKILYSPGGTLFSLNSPFPFT